jgi:hypothetical protein
MSAILFRVGFVFTTEIRDILENRFQEDPDPKECVRAMMAIKEHGTLTLSKFMAWKSLLKERFGNEVFKTCEISADIGTILEVMVMFSTHARDSQDGPSLSRKSPLDLRMGIQNGKLQEHRSSFRALRSPRITPTPTRFLEPG